MIIAALLLALGGPGAQAPPAPAPFLQQAESLAGAGQRLARLWRSHDFDSLTAGASDVLLLLPGATGPSALRAGQAAELLRGYTAGTQEVGVDVVAYRDVDRERAYVEVQRVFTVRGTEARRAQTVYFGLRRAGSGYRLYEVRIVP
jgi:hypothetical protein